MRYPVAHKYSRTAKMPCASYSLVAGRDCHTGGRLALLPGTTCAGCYAQTGFYHMPDAVALRDWNLAVWEQCEKTPEGQAAWSAAHVRQIGPKAKLFRWFDSGDIRSIAMLRAIVAVAVALPDCRFWLPTHERAIVTKYLADGGSFPSNLIVRVSAVMYGAYEPVPGFHTSSVDSGVGKACSAVEAKCLSCRDCWDASISNIDYHPISKLAKLHA